MLHKFFRSPLAVQSVFLALCVFAVFILVYDLSYDLMPNLVMRNLFIGGKSFIAGQNPYEATLENGADNQFKYSPLFALLASGMMAADNLKLVKLINGLWVLLGTTVFMFGLGRWADLTKKYPVYVTVALLACLFDLSISTMVRQANALIIGLTLLGLAEYRDGRLFSAGAILVLATNLKVYPVIFFIPLALCFRPAYWLGVLCAGLSAFLLPAFFVGWSHNLAMHLAWVQVVLHDTAGDAILNLPSAFQRVGLGGLGQALRWLVLLATIPLFFAYLPLVKRIDWRPWMAFGMAALLLLSPRTEVYTYVLLAPSYVLLALWCADLPKPGLRLGGGIIFTLLAAVIAFCPFFDPEWKISESPREILRVIGALGFWALTAGIVGHQEFHSLKPAKPVVTGKKR